MNNEPVAWMDGEGGFYHNDDYEVCKEHNIANDLIPLYTHPVSQYKAITNTKIEPTVVSYTHPVKELDEQFKKGFEAGKEEGWKAHKFHHPVKEQDESFDRTASHMAGEYVSYPVKEQGNPVAWRSQDSDGYWSVYQSPVEGAEPLYTGFKELTDEEIAEIAMQCSDMDEYGNSQLKEYEFARAILRKAQEK